MTPWVNLDSRDGQIPPQPESERLHARPPPTTRRRRRPGTSCAMPTASRSWPSGGWGRVAGRLHQPGGGALVARVGQAGAGAGRRGHQGRRRRRLLRPRRTSRLADGRTGARGRLGTWAACTASACSARSTRSIPARGVLFGRSGWTGQHATGLTWGGDQASDFWSLRALVVAALSGGLQRRLELLARRRRLPRPPAGRALPAGAARPLAAVRLLHAADARARADAPGAVALRRAAWLDLYRGYVLLHEQLVPYVRAAARTAARTGPADHPPAVPDRPRRPARLVDHRRLRLRPGAVGRARCSTRGRASARSRCRAASGSRPGRGEVRGGGELVVQAPLHRIPVWVRAGSIVVTYPADARRRRARRHARG